MTSSLALLTFALVWAPNGQAWFFEKANQAGDAGAGSPVLLPLTRRLQGTKRSFYVGNVRAGHGAGGGQPQEMLVFFDTGSGHVLLDSTRCESIPCLQHHQYSPVESARAIGSHVFDMDSHGHEVPMHSANSTMHFDMADEHTTKKAKATGDIVHDTMCLGLERNKAGSRNEACADVGFVAATTMSDELFLDAPFDGIVGLGLEGISISKECNWFSQLVAKGSPPRFAFYLPAAGADREQTAEIAFGGYNPSRLAAPLEWVPVVKPEAGYWQLRVSTVRIGESTFDCATFSDGCLAIVDTSSPSLGLPEEFFPDLSMAPGAHCGGPDILITFAAHSGKSTTLNISAQEYMDHANGNCVSQLHPLTSQDRSTTGSRKFNGKVVRPAGMSALMLILGEPVLQRYYTVFDTDTKQVGFGLSASESQQSYIHDEIILVQKVIESSCKASAESEPPLTLTECKAYCLQFCFSKLSDYFHGKQFGPHPTECMMACEEVLPA